MIRIINTLKRALLLAFLCTILSTHKWHHHYGVTNAFHHAIVRTRLLSHAGTTTTTTTNTDMKNSNHAFLVVASPRRRCLDRLFSSLQDDDDDDDDDREGMTAAFKALDELDSLDLDDDDDLLEITDGSLSPPAIAVREEGVDDIEDIRRDLLLEMDDDDDNNNNNNNNIVRGVNKDAIIPQEKQEEEEEEMLEDADGLGGGRGPEPVSSGGRVSALDDDFVDRAIEEALREAQDVVPTEMKLSESIFEDEQLMKDIEQVFEEASKKIVSSVEDIRKEQKELTDASANARRESSRIDVQSLAEAEGSISRLLGKVNEETAEVRSAMTDLERVKQELDDDPLTKLSNLKEAGPLKQSTLVLSLLFAGRATTDLLNSSDGNDLVAVAVQAAIAAVCAILYFL